MSDEKRAVPRHVAIILDGNGRWAKKRFLPRNAGHAAGSKNVEKICAAAWDMGIEYVTMYAFSTENWSRPKEEVDALMKLLYSYLKDCLKTSEKNNMQVRVIGDNWHRICRIRSVSWKSFRQKIPGCIFRLP